MRQLPILGLVCLLGYGFTQLLSPRAAELGSLTTGEPQQRLRQHAVEYAEAHWGLTIADTRDDLVVFTSGLWSAPSSWLSMDHYTVVARARRGDEPHDVFRFDVSATPDGVPVRVGFLRQLTNTGQVDERLLTYQGSRVAFANYQNGRYDAVVVLDLAGEDDAEVSQWPGELQLANRLENLQRTGQLRGMDRVQYLFSYPPTDLTLAFVDEPGVLRMGMGARGDLELNLAAPDDAVRADGTFTVRRLPKIAKPLVHVITDIVRDLPFIGPEKMAVVQRIVFDLADLVTRQEHNLFGGETVIEVSGTTEPVEIPEEPREGFGVLLGEEGRRSRLPLERAAGLVDQRRSSEGRWAPVEDTVPQTPEGVPLFYQTYIRVDEERDYAVVHITVWDPGRVRLGIVAGTEEPLPATSALGTGRIPRDGELPMQRLIGAFNGGFQTVHGTFGMIAQRDVLVPPEGRMATVATFDGDRVALGRWDENYTVPGDLRGLRQNLRPLVENGAANPDGRTRWGWALGQTRTTLGSPLTTRTGLCRFENGALGYFWGTQIDGDMLGNAMVAAGCDFGIHLDMNPGHTGMEYYSVADGAGEEFEARTMRRGMGLARHPRYIRTDTRDFFYLMQRPNPVEDSIPPACGREFRPRYRRLTATGEPLEGENEILLAPARITELTDNPLCDEPHITSAVVRVPGELLSGRVRFYRDAPGRDVILGDRATIMIPVATVEADEQAGLNAQGRLAFGGDAVDPVPAFPLDPPPEGPGLVLGLDDHGDVYLITSEVPAAARITAQRLPLALSYWIPTPPGAGLAMRFDNGEVRTFPEGTPAVVPAGAVIWLDVAGASAVSLPLDAVLAIGAPPEEPTE